MAVRKSKALARQLVGHEPSRWDETIYAFARSKQLAMPELLDIVVDATRAVHGLMYHADHNRRIVENVLLQLNQRESSKQGEAIRWRLKNVRPAERTTKS